jgi:hypothetical protein
VCARILDDEESVLPPGGVIVTVKNCRGTEGGRPPWADVTTCESAGEAARGRGFVAGVLHAKEPNWVGAFVGGRIAVEEVERVVTVFCGGQQSSRLALG